MLRRLTLSLFFVSALLWCTGQNITAQEPLTEEGIAFLQALAACESEYNTPVQESIRGVLWNPFCCFKPDEGERLTCLQASTEKTRDLMQHMGDVLKVARKASVACSTDLANVDLSFTCSKNSNGATIEDYLSTITCYLNSYRTAEEQLWNCLKD